MHCGFIGFISLKFQKNLTVLEHTIEKLDIAIAYFVEKYMKNIIRGAKIPPPPIPEIAHNMLIANKKAVPPISNPPKPKSVLCTQIELVLF